MSVPPPCFLLVDDHALFRTGLALMLPHSWPQARVVQAASWGEAVLALQREQPDLIMLDVHLPDGHGLEDLAALKRHAPTCPVLLMSAEVDAAQVQQARESGAAGFLPKAASADEVMSAVGAVLAGQQAFAAIPYASRKAADAPVPGVCEGGVASSPAWGAKDAVKGRKPPRELSARQRDILGYLGRGTPNKSIARHLGIQECEVRAEVSWLTEWLGARSREEAYASAVELGLVKP
jgi:two-component system nitrate/nitrite response regulator NarL